MPQLKSRLGVNIDHVATLRQARGEEYPSISEAARICLESGAEQITIHLREDRRHIQDPDVDVVKLVTRRYGALLNLEIGCAEEILQIAESTKPDWICLVPEKREEQTTEGGLDLIDPKNYQKVLSACERLKKSVPGVKISLFVEANEQTLLKCTQMPIDAVEIHTGEYAHAANSESDLTGFIADFKRGAEIIKGAKLGYHAGHGLSEENILPLLELNYFEEYNIGHWIVCQAVFEGLGPVVKRLHKLLGN